MTDEPSASPPPTRRDRAAAASPSYPSASAADSLVPDTAVPGRTLGIVALVGAIVLSVLSIVWLVLGIVALIQSRRAGRGNGFALAAIIVSSVALIASVVVAIVAITATSNLIAFCATNGPGSYVYNGSQITCS